MYHGVACRKLREKNLRACLIRQCLRRSVPRVVGRVRIFLPSGGCGTVMPRSVKSSEFATLVAAVVFVARKDISLFHKVIEVEQLFCLFFRNAAIKIQKILSSLHVE